MTEQAEHAEQRTTYDVPAAQEKWRKVWEDLNPFQAVDDGTRERRYALTMFPYPSGDLHMGHAEVMALHDVIARYWWQRGYDVMNPIGWDSFGLPAENAAIKRDEHPATYTYANIETQAESFRRYGISFDWSRRLHTSDPEYYRWTQWLFLRFRERGLAYRKSSPVNWCPNDQTVLANEQVVGGMCERCGAEVTKRELTQWYFKVTEYAQRLLDDMEMLKDTWPERVLAMQRNWIGRSEGAHVDFEIEAREDTGGGTLTTAGGLVFVGRNDGTHLVDVRDTWRTIQGRAADLAALIQLSVAPVFLLTGITGILSVMTHRLARVIDLDYLRNNISKQRTAVINTRTASIEAFDSPMIEAVSVLFTAMYTRDEPATASTLKGKWVL